MKTNHSHTFAFSIQLLASAFVLLATHSWGSVSGFNSDSVFEQPAISQDYSLPDIAVLLDETDAPDDLALPATSLSLTYQNPAASASYTSNLAGSLSQRTNCIRAPPSRLR